MGLNGCALPDGEIAGRRHRFQGRQRVVSGAQRLRVDDEAGGADRDAFGDLDPGDMTLRTRHRKSPESGLDSNSTGNRDCRSRRFPFDPGPAVPA